MIPPHFDFGMTQKFSPLLRGLVVAAHTPFNADGSLNLAVVENQAAHYLKNNLSIVFIGGTTGEFSSLATDERRALAERWMAVTRGTTLKVIVHAGSNCLDDASALAAHSQALNAAAVAACAPSYFKPRDARVLAESMAVIAAAAPALPFYYYEIPSFTGLAVSPSAFLALASERIPNLAGLKFTSNNLMEYQLCLNYRHGAFDVAFGFDEMLLAALALGAKGAVGSTYNFAAPVYQRMLQAFARQDFAAARQEQMRSVQLVQVLARSSFMGATKALMESLGVPVGPPRLPNVALTEIKSFRAELEQLGFFDWI
jgi:N-acetylneuraminate lyase